MKPITKPQIKKLQFLYRELGLTDSKKEMLLEYTNGRTDSTAKLTMDEARDLIQQLSAQDPAAKERKTIWHLAYLAGIIYGDTIEDLKMNEAKLNMFLRTKGTVKKDLPKMKLEELKKVHRQFEGIIRNNKKTKENKVAQEVTTRLLTELNIPVKN